MEIVNFGHFTMSSDGPYLVFSDEQGNDWYELRRSLTEWEPDGTFRNAIYGTWLSVDRDGIVRNVEYDPSRLMPNDRTVLGVDADHSDFKEGMVFRDGVISAPPPPTIEQVRATMHPLTPREFRDALIDADIMPDQVTAAIEQMPDPKARAKALNAWEYPTQFIRTDPLVGQIGSIFGLTPETIDALWIEASAA